MAIQSFYETLIYVSEVKSPDGMGGFVATLTEGPTFKGAIFTTNRQELLVADKKTGTAGYIMATDKTTPIEYCSMFRRMKNGELFKVKTRPEDNEAPSISRVQIKQMEIELITLPKSEVR